MLPRTTMAPTTQTTIDKTADWKTYTNADEGFSFRYPPDIKQINDPVTDSVTKTLVEDNTNDCPTVFTVLKTPVGESTSNALGMLASFGHKTKDNGDSTYTLVAFVSQGGCAQLSHDSEVKALDTLDGMYSTFKFTK